MKRKILFFIFLFFGTTLANVAKAVCPVCVVAVGSGLGLARFLGVDDLISSIWIGALLASLSIWTIIWLVKKGWGFKYQRIVIPSAYYLLTLLPLWYLDIMGHPFNTILGIDKIMFGSILGTAVFLASVRLHNYLKQKNNGKSFFAYQKVILPFVVLLILSIFLNTLIIWKII